MLRVVPADKEEGLRFNMRSVRPLEIVVELRLSRFCRRF